MSANRLPKVDRYAGRELLRTIRDVVSAEGAEYAYAHKEWNELCEYRKMKCFVCECYGYRIGTQNQIGSQDDEISDICKNVYKCDA